MLILPKDFPADFHHRGNQAVSYIDNLDSSTLIHRVRVEIAEALVNRFSFAIVGLQSAQNGRDEEASRKTKGLGRKGTAHRALTDLPGVARSQFSDKFVC